MLSLLCRATRRYKSLHHSLVFTAEPGAAASKQVDRAIVPARVSHSQLSLAIQAGGKASPACGALCLTVASRPTPVRRMHVERAEQRHYDTDILPATIHTVPDILSLLEVKTKHGLHQPVVGATIPCL